MNIRGFATNMFGWKERYKAEGMETSKARIFRDIAQAGFQAVEVEADPETVKLARSYGLTVSGTYIGLKLHEPFEPGLMEETVLPSAIRLAEAGGSDFLLNADPKGGWGARLPKNEEDMKRQGDNLTRIADRLKEYGLNVCMHNHAANRHNAEADLRSVTAYAGTEVGLCIDTGWALVAGCDPIGWIRQWPERVRAFHLRNQHGADPSEDLLDGDLDMEKLVRAIAEINYAGWLSMELWHPEGTRAKRSMIDDAERSVRYLKERIGTLS